MVRPLLDVFADRPSKQRKVQDSQILERIGTVADVEASATGECSGRCCSQCREIRTAGLVVQSIAMEIVVRKQRLGAILLVE